MWKDKGGKGGGEGRGREIEEKYEGSLPCMAASSTDRLPPAGCTIAIVSTFFAPPPAYLSTPRILHLQGGVTLKTLPVLDYPVPLSLSLSPSFPLSLSHSFFPPCPPRYILLILFYNSIRSINRIIIPEKCAISKNRTTINRMTLQEVFFCIFTCLNLLRKHKKEFFKFLKSTRDNFSPRMS